jgi:diaminohydroxyphosphoribosylaminopyrimidine deaminase/5-amino-6-(5-phosphoribosylamino)uracil reductase
VESALFDQTIQTIILTEQEKENQENLVYETIDFSKNIAKQICEVLYKHELQSRLIHSTHTTRLICQLVSPVYPSP